MRIATKIKSTSYRVPMLKTILFFVMSFSLMANGVMIRHDIPDKKYRKYAKDAKFNSVGALSIGLPDSDFEKSCTGILINPRIVLTAAHCFSSFSEHDLNNLSESSFMLAHDRYASSWRRVKRAAISAIVHERCWEGQGAELRVKKFCDDDIALVQLAKPINNRQILRIDYGDPDVLIGETVDFAGFGQTATGLEFEDENGSYQDSSKKRAARAKIGAVRKKQANYLMFTFAPDKRSTELLGASLNGDSGAPVIFETDNGPVIVGIFSKGRKLFPHENEQHIRRSLAKATGRKRVLLPGRTPVLDELILKNRPFRGYGSRRHILHLGTYEKFIERNSF